MSAPVVGGRRPWRGFAIASAFAALAACATPILPPPPEAAAPAEPEPAQVSDTPEAPKPNIDSSPAARAARLAGRPPPPPAESERDSHVRLIGLSREFVLELLGPAGFVRRDGPVQIWRYTGNDCFLDVFLFREHDAFRVNHVEARSKNAEPVSVNGCYQRLVAARRGGTAG